MKKKFWGILLSAALSLGVAACGQTKNEMDEQGGKKQEAQTAAEDSAAEEAQTPQSAAETDVYEAQLPDGEEEADIFVEPIKDLPENFIKGMDVSSVIAEEESGVKYYNEQGEEEDLFRVLADAGVNYIRVRVWNDPYDADGNGYGGGNCDVEKAAEIGARAAKYGMKLLVDFHYSDFWADPAKQFAPKAWADMALKEKGQALYTFTKESLQTILDAGADIGMAQIGNEINNGMSGEKNWANVTELLKQGSRAVREIASETGQEIQIAVHFTNIEDHDKTVSYAQTLEDAGLDYDIFGVSYYPYWHGTMDNMEAVLKDLKNSYGKETAILETSYCYTTEDGDGFANSVGEDELTEGYAASVQSQANCLRDLMAAASDASALGVFYWEGAWIPVGDSSAAEENEKRWETYGSGWASSYSASYDKDDAGQYYGGCSWDNQALFDFTGHPLPSLDVFKYVNYGASCEKKVDFVEETAAAVNIGEEIQLPTAVKVTYNDRSFNGTESVTWDETQIQAIDTKKEGEYTVNGKLEDGTEVSCQVTVANKNWLLNPGFEQNDISMWHVSHKGDANPTDIQEKETDAFSGANSFHFWSESAQEFQVEQTVTGLEAGTYKAAVHIQGGDVGADAGIYLYVIQNGKTISSAPVTLDGWCVWQTPELAKIKVAEGGELTVGVSVTCGAGGWGTIDDFSLIKVKE